MLGSITFIAFLVIGGIIIYQIGPGNRSTNKIASKHDIRFVLNWCNLGDERTEEVVHSYASSRSFDGDHLDGHAIRVSHLNETELVHDERGGRGGWCRGDALSGTAKQAVDFAKGWLGSSEMPWFPTVSEIQSSNMFIYVWSVHMAKPRSDPRSRGTQSIWVCRK